MMSGKTGALKDMLCLKKLQEESKSQILHDKSDLEKADRPHYFARGKRNDSLLIKAEIKA